MYRSITGRLLTHAKYACSYERGCRVQLYRIFLQKSSAVRLSQCNQPGPVGLVGHVYPARVRCLPNGSKRAREGGFHSLSREVARKMSNIGGNSRSTTPPSSLSLSLSLSRRMRRYIHTTYMVLFSMNGDARIGN